MTVAIDLSGQVALVTGAGAGIGREIASWMARAGATVVVNDLVEERCASTVARLQSEGSSAPVVAMPADMSDDATIAAVVQRVRDELGSLDIAVNNVGMLAGRPAMATLDVTRDDLLAIHGVNALATTMCCIAEGRAMVEQGRGGVIINVSSGETTRPAPALAVYGSSKAAINHLTNSLAVELGPHGIRVVAIAPGTTLTEQVRAVMSDEHVAAITASNPLRRMTDPEELGRLAVFLASDLARCITGQLILADAGAHLSRTRPPNIGTT